MLSQHVISDFAKGKYMTWQIKDHVKVTKLRGPDAVLSGVFVHAGTRIDTKAFR
ncbi:MAG: hypothetical protein ACREJC_11270 [Tepidisphaeraceae bacterium]